MLLLERILPFFSSFLILLDFELTLLRPKLIYEFVGISFIIIFFTIFQFTGHNLKKKEFWHFLTISFFLIIATFLFLIFLETNLFKQLLIIFCTFLAWLYLENLFIFHRRSVFHQAYSIENISSYIGLFSAFLLYSSSFALRVFLLYPVWLLTILSAIITFILTYQNFWVHKIEFKKYQTYLIFLSLICAELIWAIFNLPTSYLVGGMIMTMVFYVLVNLSRLYILGSLEKKVISRYLTIAIFVIILLLATAQWL